MAAGQCVGGVLVSGTQTAATVIGSVILGVAAGVAGITGGTATAAQLRGMIDRVDVASIHYSATQRTMSVQMQAMPAQSLVDSGAFVRDGVTVPVSSWGERRWCPTSADDELVSLLAACGVDPDVGAIAVSPSQGMIISDGEIVRCGDTMTEPLSLWVAACSVADTTERPPILRGDTPVTAMRCVNGTCTSEVVP